MMGGRDIHDNQGVSIDRAFKPLTRFACRRNMRISIGAASIILSMSALAVACRSASSSGAGGGSRSVATSAPRMSCGPADVRLRARTEPGPYTGRYRNGDDILYLASCDGTSDSVAVSPLPWTGIEYALRAEGDSFVVADRTRRTIAFERDGVGAVVAVRTTGFGIGARFLRDDQSSPTVLEHLLFDVTPDESATAVIRALAASPVDPLTAIAVALERHPLRAAHVAAVIGRVLREVSPDARLLSLHAQALSAAGRHDDARTTYERAQTIAPSDSAIRELGILVSGGVMIPDTGWRVPFPAESLLRAPTRAEVDATWQAIASRSRASVEPRLRAQHIIVVAGNQFHVAIIEHRSAGARHVGALITPVQPLAGCCATIVEIKGTTPDYSPLNLDRGVRSLRMLGSAARAYAFVVPAIRGEVLQSGQQEFVADGDRADGWDGGADDALALLAAAAALDVRVDPSRACTFGHSRGGAVALLAAERDRRIRCAIAIAAPTDWFAAMWPRRWPAAGALRVAMRTHARPSQAGGQFIERFVQPVAAGRWSLREARSKMIASSPLYFAERLPATLAIFGAEDNAVPVQNAIVLDSALRRRGSPAAVRVVHIAAMAGHDTDPALVVRLVPSFLSRMLGTPVGTRHPGADAR